MPTPLTDADKVLRNDTGKDIVDKLDDIAQALGVGVNADQINYDNTESGLTADDVQEAIDEVVSDLEEKTTYKKTATPGSIVSFSDGGDNIPLKSLVTEIVPIQTGTGTPSPTNVRAISGHNSVNVIRCGVNIWNEDWTMGYYSATTGALVETSTTALASSKHLKIYPNLKIKCICPSTLSFVIFRYDKNGNYINRITGITSGSVITIPSDVYEIAFHIANYGSDTSYTYQNNVSLNVPDSDSQYHSYNGNKVTISLGSTVYGGSLECVEGEGQSILEYVELTGDSPEYWQMPQTSIFYETTTFVDGLTTDSKICNRYEYGGVLANASDLSGMENNKFYCLLINQYKRFYFKDTRFTSLADWKTEIGTNHLQICYEKATPTSLSVSGANIPTLSGVNNVYTDCGDIQSLEYYNNKADELADLIRLMTRS